MEAYVHHCLMLELEVNPGFIDEYPELKENLVSHSHLLELFWEEIDFWTPEQK